MFTPRGKQRGFTLVELIIVMAILGVLAAVVIPQVTGFLGESKEKSYDTDQNTLQSAVDAYHAFQDVWPIAGTPGTPSASNDSYLGISLLVDEDYIKSVASVQSANTYNDASATGTYGWYLDANEEIDSIPAFDPNNPVYP